MTFTDDNVQWILFYLLCNYEITWDIPWTAFVLFKQSLYCFRVSVRLSVSITRADASARAHTHVCFYNLYIRFACLPMLIFSDHTYITCVCVWGGSLAMFLSYYQCVSVSVYLYTQVSTSVQIHTIQQNIILQITSSALRTTSSTIIVREIVCVCVRVCVRVIDQIRYIKLTRYLLSTIISL